jgi:hypothetical protein
MLSIPVLGELHRNDQYPSELYSDDLFIPLLGGVLRFSTYLGEECGSAADRAVTAFLELGEADRENVTPHLYGDYLKMEALVFPSEGGLPEISSESEIWSHVRFTSLSIDEEEGLIYISVLGECDWDREHGIQIVFRNGNELVRVSGQDGHLTD